MISSNLVGSQFVSDAVVSAYDRGRRDERAAAQVAEAAQEETKAPPPIVSTEQLHAILRASHGRAASPAQIRRAIEAAQNAGIHVTQWDGEAKIRR